MRKVIIYIKSKIMKKKDQKKMSGATIKQKKEKSLKKNLKMEIILPQKMMKNT